MAGYDFKEAVKLKKSYSCCVSENLVDWNKEKKISEVHDDDKRTNDLSGKGRLNSYAARTRRGTGAYSYRRGESFNGRVGGWNTGG